MALYDRVADLDLSIAAVDLELQERDVAGGTRTTTVVSLSGDGEVGRGEDVTWDADVHRALVDAGGRFDLAGDYALDSFSGRLDSVDLFPGDEPPREGYRNYRRWAFESAALDLALKQADTNLAAAVDRPYRPVRFVVSNRLGDPPTTDRVDAWLDVDPTLEFKLDPTAGWTDDLAAALAETGAVRVLDLKGQYEGTTVDQPADPALYERVLDAFPDAVVEDPKLTGETRPLFEGHEDRVSWDAPITDVGSIEALPFEPRWLNVKPSRFGTAASLFDAVEYCLDAGVQLYGGGQLELSVGRRHLHALASVFYPDGPNDVAPQGYNDPEPRAGLPASPLAPPAAPRGLEW